MPEGFIAKASRVAAVAALQQAFSNLGYGVLRAV